MNPTLTIGQLVVLGAATVVGSFGLNAWFIRHEFGRVESRLEAFGKLLESPDGVLVRLGKVETRVDGLEDDRDRSSS